MSEEELIETLRVFENKRVEQLEEPARNVFYAIMKLADERDKYKNIIKEVREYIEEKYDYILGNDKFLDHDERIDRKQIKHIIETLKGSDK